MKRRELIRYLEKYGCVLLREGGSHAWWINTHQNRRSAVPRHSEINDKLIIKICKDLGIPKP